MAANIADQLATLLFWGGEMIKHRDMGSVDYSEPPKTMCFLSGGSRYDELVTKVYTAMDTNAHNTILVLFGRYPMFIPGGQTVFVPVPLIDDQSWQWFLRVATLSQPIHVYAIAERRTNAQSTSQDDDDDDDDDDDVNSDEWKERRLKVIVDKLTPQNVEGVVEQVKEVKIDNVVTLTGFVSQIYNKAVMEPDFCEMYVDVFNRLNCMLPELYVDNTKETFRRLLLNRCQEGFERDERDRGKGDMRRKLGNIKLIGELYKKMWLTERIIHECIKKLLGDYKNPDEEDIEALCHLMHTIGETIDHLGAKKHMDFYFEMVTKMISHPTLSSKLKEMLVHLVELRKNMWQ